MCREGCGAGGGRGQWGEGDEVGGAGDATGAAAGEQGCAGDTTDAAAGGAAGGQCCAGDTTEAAAATLSCAGGEARLGAGGSQAREEEEQTGSVVFIYSAASGAAGRNRFLYVALFFSDAAYAFFRPVMFVFFGGKCFLCLCPTNMSQMLSPPSFWKLSTRN